MATKTLIEIAESRPDVLSTAKSQGGDPFTAGTGANTWLNDWWNTAGKNEYPDVTLGQPTVITPESMAGGDAYDLSNAPDGDNGSNANVAVAGAKTQAEKDAQAAADKKVADEKAAKDAATEDITGILTSLEGEGTEEAAALEEKGVPGMEIELADVVGQIGVLNAEYEQMKVDEEAMLTQWEGKALSTSYIAGKQGQVQREFRSKMNQKASEIGILQAQGLAVQGKLTAAKNAVNRAIDLKYDSLRLQLDTKKFLFDVIREDLSDAEAAQLKIQEDIVARQEQEMEDQKAIDKQVQNIMLSVVGVAPNDVLAQISQAGSVLEASQIASPYLAETPAGAYKVGTIREFTEGNQTVTRQLTEDGWVEVSRGARWKATGGGTPGTPETPIEESLTAGQVRDIKYYPNPPEWFNKKWEKKLGWRIPQPYPSEKIQEEWDKIRAEESTVDEMDELINQYLKTNA